MSSPRLAHVAFALLLASTVIGGGCGDHHDGTDAAVVGSAAGEDGGKGGSSSSPRDAGPHDPSADSGPAPPAPAQCDVTPPTRCSEPAPSYADDVRPIIAARCLGCHDGKGEQWPLTTESHVASWFIQIRDAMIRCQMPPADSGITMPTEERETILHWLRCQF